jgi:signal peptidase I
MSQKVRPEARNADDSGAPRPGGRAARPQPARTNYVREIIETIVLTAIVFLVVHASAQPYRVDGPSMQPGLHTDEYVLISPILYAFGGSPQRGDVIVFHPPTDPTQSYVKRVIGIPGDTVVISNNAITVNGKQLSEPYLFQQDANIPETEGGCQDLHQAQLGSDQYLVLGDNRGDSLDSRCFGIVPRANIIGKAFLLALPLNNLHFINTFPGVFAGIKQ